MPIKTQQNELYGLVLAGGQSQRMKRDKAHMNYHGKAQFHYAFELLKPFCRQVFISLRPEQVLHEEYQSWPTVTDDPAFGFSGPLVGILSAMKRYPQKAWFVLACDLPFVTSATIIELIKHRNVSQPITAYKSASNGLPEPLCAIYEPEIFSQLADFGRHNITCPRFIITQLNILLFDLPFPLSLTNVNTPEEFEKSKGLLILQKKMGLHSSQRLTDGD